MFNKSLCPQCDASIKASFDFCPYCGCDIRDPRKAAEDYGLLGKHDALQGAPVIGGNSLSATDRMVASIFNSLMKTLEKQLRNTSERPEFSQAGNGITIKIGQPQESTKQKQSQRTISSEQISRMKGLPRVEAKSQVKRLGDKVVCELKAPGISSLDDVFISKLASGYEVRAISEGKVYLNTLPIELPLKKYSLTEQGLTFEFLGQ